MPLRQFQDSAKQHHRVLLIVDEGQSAVQPGKSAISLPAWFDAYRQADDLVYVLEPRGVGTTRWTRQNPPNYVERAHVLVGQTADTGRIRDVVAVAKFLARQHDHRLILAGRGPSGILAAYAVLWLPESDGLICEQPSPTHMASSAPQLLNALRVCDIADVLGMVAPKRLQLRSSEHTLNDRVRAIYDAAAANEQLQLPSRD